jgi:glycosyltransferase involved in cell wall biosynthesis
MNLNHKMEHVVSVIIPTFNRFGFLLNALKSVKEQTYKNIEIIVVNDCSTEKEYYEYAWRENGITIIHLEQNTKNLFGFACAGYVRNKGIEAAHGTFIAFCDDDDMWFPSKIELQMNAMQNASCDMACTDGLIGSGVYDANKSYQKYNAEHYYDVLKNIYKSKNSNFLANGFPEIWTLDFIRIHNCIICSSVLIRKDVLDKINNMKCVPNGEEDYDCWLRALTHANCVYVPNVCFYYDNGHGYGRNYEY